MNKYAASVNRLMNERVKYIDDNTLINELIDYTDTNISLEGVYKRLEEIDFDMTGNDELVLIRYKNDETSHFEQLHIMEYFEDYNSKRECELYCIHCLVRFLINHGHMMEYPPVHPEDQVLTNIEEAAKLLNISTITFVDNYHLIINNFKVDNEGHVYLLDKDYNDIHRKLIESAGMIVRG